jgi:hypothetical protein
MFALAAISLQIDRGDARGWTRASKICRGSNIDVYANVNIC